MSSESQQKRAAGRPLFVSLSGGGIRATLFAIGALIALLDAGQLSRVRVVSSVSGGSIASALLAAGLRASEGDASKTRETMLDAADSLRKRGVFLTPRWWTLLSAIVITSLVVAPILLNARVVMGRDGEPVDAAAYFWSAAGLYFAFNLAVVWFGRRHWQLDTYAQALASLRTDGVDADVPVRGPDKKEWKRFPLADLPAKPSFVFCAADLQTAKPVFFARGGVATKAGLWRDSDATLLRSVYASAAFPFFFPAQRVRTQEGKKWATDGGVVNNLGTDWKDAADHLELPMPVAGDHWLIVNASRPAPPEATKKYWFQIRTLGRSYEILNENTVAPRLQRLAETADHAICDVSTTPLEQLTSILKSESDGASSARRSEARERAACLRDGLTALPSFDSIDDRSKRSAAIRTHLFGVRRNVANDLLAHGYLSASIALYCALGARDLPDVRRVPQVAGR